MAFAYNNRPIPVPHTGSAGQQRVFVCHVRIGMDRDGRNVQLAPKRPFVQRLNVFQSMLEPISAQVDLILRHRVKHERVIRVRGVTQGKDFGAVVRLFFHLDLDRSAFVRRARRNSNVAQAS